jgi:hypothetical protein
VRGQSPFYHQFIKPSIDTYVAYIIGDTLLLTPTSPSFITLSNIEMGEEL